MRKKLTMVLLCLVMAMGLMGLAGCGGSGGTAEGDGQGAAPASTAADPSLDVGVDLSDWDAVVEAARGTHVNFYGWGGDETFNKYMTGTVKDYMKENYDIDFEWIGVASTDEAVTLVSDEKQAGSKLGEGSNDLLWLGAFQFKTIKDNDLLYPGILNYVPNVKKYIADDNVLVTHNTDTDFGDDAVPWDPLQAIFIGDKARTSWFPNSAEEFLKWAQEYPGKVTYPTTENSYGKQFVWMMLMDYLGEDWYKDLDENSSYDEIKAAMEPCLKFLRDLNPYLWNEGKTYPATTAQYIEMFSSGETCLLIDWAPYSVGSRIADGTFSKTTEAFLVNDTMVESWEDGNVVIPYNAANVPGALVTINALITPELGYAMLAETGYPPAVDINKCSDEEKKLADIDVNQNLTPEDVAKAKKIPFIPAWLADPLNEIWLNEVAGKYNE